jgi:septal ring factor EnvC (AmiA/AmiB activator)
MGHTDSHNPPAPARAPRWGIAFTGAAAVLAVAASAALAKPTADELNSRIAGAKDEAQALAAEIESTSAELAAAQREAIVAAEREAQITAVLAEGRAREHALEVELVRAEAELAAARDQLRRGLNALSNRLVAIYREGMPDPISILLDSDGFDDLQTRAEYLRRIQDADAALVARVRSLRDSVNRQVDEVTAAEARAEAAADQIEVARNEISAVRAAAESRAAELASLRSQRAAAVEALQANIGVWTKRIDRLEAADVQELLGGDYAIPESIVMCESGGNWEAVNPSSGAGGAYQILPSTWELYGGEGMPQDASPEEQSEIAAQIWADSGQAAWVCQA